MARYIRDSSVKKGLSPGSLVFVGERKTEDVTYELIQYNPQEYRAFITKDLGEISPDINGGNYSWLNIEGIHDEDKMREVGQLFDIHSLALEDVMNTGQRPKVEEYDNFLFITLKMLWPEGKSGKYITEQFSICLFKDKVISFQEQPGDAFDPIRERFKVEKSRLRNLGPDYLAYVLLDNIIDNYIFIVEQLGVKIERLEDDILAVRGQLGQKLLLEKLSRYKSEINYLRKTIRPTNELVLRLSKTSSPLIQSENALYLKDLLDLCYYVNESIEIYREILADQLMIFQTIVSNKMNEVMKVLTVFSAVFIPLTFLTGLYGTNFEFIPELHLRYGFYFFLAGLALTSAFTLYLFKRKKWL